MSIQHNINGVFRDTWTTHVKINGVWREADSLVNINGVWRETFNHEINEEDIVGFRMVYKFTDTIRHHDHPNLLPNRNLPVNMKLTGEGAGNMDYSQKGVLFQYDRTNIDQEGLCVYKGDLYAVLSNGQLANVTMTISKAVDDIRIPGDVPGIIEAWSTNKIAHLNIQFTGYLLYESNGYSMSGWNSLFTTTQFTDPTKFPDTMDYKKQYLIDSYNMLPIEYRDDTFDSSAYIGIARNMHSIENNMVGSYGVLDHTITEIRVNNILKPFVFEIYD